MMKTSTALLLLLLSAVPGFAQERPAVHLWMEPEWFAGVRGGFNYWTGTQKPTGSWGIAGPGISAEWSQGGESEWNSIGAAAEETKAQCERRFDVPRAGRYRIWVRYVDHRHKTEPFRVTVKQAGRPDATAELGVDAVGPANDEYKLFWGFSFGWGHFDATLVDGPATLSFTVDKAGQAWRQVDAVLLTDDLKYEPVGRAKPRFAYEDSFDVQPKAAWRGDGFAAGAGWKRPAVGGKDFSMWTGIEPDPKWWGQQDLAKLTLPEVLFRFAPPADIRAQFHKQYGTPKDVPLIHWPGLRPGLYLGTSPDLSPVTPLRQWLERTKTPFYIMTNYASPTYTAATGPATYAALTEPLAEQFLGYIHGEAVGTSGIGLPDKALAADRRGHVDALAKKLREQQTAAWSKFYKTPVSADHFKLGISCLSVDSIALAHLFHDAGMHTVGYEIDATNVHAPMRVAFERGAARQYGGSWINYASGNFGDACNYFSQKPVVPRGAPSWYHSKYAITDGVSISWYRKLYYLNFLGGASAVYWEQSLANQWILPGPGTHPIQLSPFGRATQDFQSFAQRLPDRGEPYTPIALLLSYGHAYERVNNSCKMLNVFAEDDNDRELRELFNVCWYPSGVLEGKPASPDVQSMPGGTFGDIFDVLVDRPARAKTLFDYPVVWAAGDVKLTGEILPTVEEYVKKGGTLVVNVAAAKGLPTALLGLEIGTGTTRHEQWSADGTTMRPCVSYDVAKVNLKGAKTLAWADKDVPIITRHAVGKGAVIVTLMPHLLGRDERAHPAIPYLMNGLTANLAPVEVRLNGGRRPAGEVLTQINRTRDGWLVALYNQRGIDKTQNGIARVDRRAHVNLMLTLPADMRRAEEMTEPSPLPFVQFGGENALLVRVPAGDVKVIYLRRDGK